MHNMLSTRSKVTNDHEDLWSKYFEICLSNPFNEITNSNGFVDLGSKVNHACHFAVKEKIRQSWRELDWNPQKINSSVSKLRDAMANMMTVFLETHEKVLASNLICLDGITGCTDLMAHCLAENGQAFLVPTPMCGRTYTDLVQKAGVEVCPIEIVTTEKEPPVLTVEKVMYAHRKALTMKKVVRAVFLTNPNTIGDIYSHKLLLDILEFCKKYSLHCVIDETEALSVHSEINQFNSVLKFREVPDPDRTHIIYGLNKDFGLAALGVGVIHTQSKELQDCLTRLSCIRSLTYPSMGVVANVLQDMVWCKEYVYNNKQRLASLYRFCVEYLKTNNFIVRPCPAGYHVWIDLSPYCGKTFEGERKLFEYFLNRYKLYVVPGEHCLCPIPGWFRMVISQKLPVLEAGVKRFIEAVQNYKR